MKSIREAATDLCNRWDTSLWKSTQHTAVFVHELRMALAQPEQEPVAIRQPLTKDQVDDLAEDGVFLGSVYEIARAIETAHGIKEKNDNRSNRC